ncbi:hypothetical protein OU798_12195 [Prolixibacteraceae bacterium Z1-6]|uniref:Lipoprotein n=1 Tax=Draconibacterium aestuarii TaxID=2998507 RepID=A0A9X3J534_9BACT|nr:hypothetical protein [Prolixibacteraceae bacterium Z1-6]
MQKLVLLLCLFAVLFTSCNQNRYRLSLPKINSENLKFAPEYYSEKPDLASPAITKEERELILLKTNDGRFTWMDGTVENGEPFNYKQGLQGKGNQLMADKADFPHFAEKGVHDETELRNTKTITGRSVSQITVDGRPWASSGVGFLAEDETIMSVISADNQTVKKLGLTHPDIARPLFHFWNLARDFEKQQVEINVLLYNSHEVEFKIQGSRGWQESIFDDEILGTGHIEIWRQLSLKEIDFLKRNYWQLSSDQFEELQKMVSHFHTSEMVLFYINRYGFYEGHTEYRPDPVTVALVFGLTSIEKVHFAAGGDLYSYFTMHFTQNPD